MCRAMAQPPFVLYHAGACRRDAVTEGLSGARLFLTPHLKLNFKLPSSSKPTQVQPAPEGPVYGETEEDLVSTPLVTGTTTYA